MDLFNVRRDFSLKTLNESDALPDPIAMLQLWIDNAIEAKALEPNAMVLSTVSAEGKPSSRVVLLKELKNNGLVFFSNYESKKGNEMDKNPNVAATFIWHELERQVRVEGRVAKLSGEESDLYYNMRPKDSRIGAWASPQSRTIADRQYLEKEVERYAALFEGKEINRPPRWGGYLITPTLLEFWQGRKNRLHDRIEYQQEGNKWVVKRLAP